MTFPPFPLVFLMLGVLPLSAQQPLPLHPPSLPPTSPAPFPPVPMPPNFPWDLLGTKGGMSAGGFLDLRRKPAFRAVIEKKSVTPGGFSITLKSPQGTSSYSEMTNNEDALKVVKHLVVGREYAFPKVFDEVLGKNAAAAAPRPTVRAPGIMGLRTGEPFRARVAKLEVTAGSVALELHCVDGQRLVVQHRGGGPIRSEVESVAGLLRQGETYELPHALLPESAGTQGRAVEPSPEMKVLEGFIGGWEMSLAHDPARKAIVHYVWKQDGRGLWRETWDEPEKERNNVRAVWLITYDPVRKCYLETLASNSLNPQPLREMEMRWVPETGAQVLRGTADKPVPGTQVIGRRKLTSPDRLEWSFQYTKPDGSPPTESSGAYERVKR